MIALVAAFVFAVPLELRLEARPQIVFAPVLNGYGAVAELALGRVFSPSPHADVKMELGVVLGYANAPYAQAAWLGRNERVNGAEHRVQGWVVIGSAVRLTESRRLVLGLQLALGFTHLRIAGTLTNAQAAVSVRRDDSDTLFVLGVDLYAAVIIAHGIGVSAHVVGHPLPWAFRVTGYASLSLGVIALLPI
ncbi:MAG: hypothetical protein IT381_12205 [Deltaproteobacteria bacterium]|nr:hypothetical protein [Deltaproteobacteria bacterium]